LLLPSRTAHGTLGSRSAILRRHNYAPIDSADVVEIRNWVRRRMS
jgi:hypothetical protein